jgi:integrase
VGLTGRDRSEMIDTRSRRSASEASPAASHGEEVGSRADTEEAIPMNPGIQRRTGAHGRTRYRVRVKRGGQKFTGTFPSEEEALVFWARAIAACDGRGEPPEPPRAVVPVHAVPAGRALTIEDAARRLVRGMRDGSARTKKGQPYKPSVVRKYEEQLRLLVIPRIGRVAITTLTAGDCQRLVDSIAAELTAEHARKALTALRVALRLAQRYGEIDTNPCAGTTVPLAAEGEKPPRIITPEEAAAILARCELDDTRLGRSFAAPLYALAFGSGLRLGELLALRWGTDGLDLDSALVRVRDSLDRVRDADGRYPLVAPKSRASRRDVPLTPEDVARLRKHRLASGRPPDGAFVFANADGEPLSPVPAYRAWKRACRSAIVAPAMEHLEEARVAGSAAAIAEAEAALKAARSESLPRPHDTRHAYATHLLALGMTAHAVADLMGHEDAALVTRRYGHALPDELASAGDRLSAWRKARGL